MGRCVSTRAQTSTASGLKKSSSSAAKLRRLRVRAATFFRRIYPDTGRAQTDVVSRFLICRVVEQEADRPPDLPARRIVEHSRETNEDTIEGTQGSTVFAIFR